MLAFAAIGIVVGLIAAFILLRDGLITIRLMLAMTGTLNNPDGRIAIGFVVVGITILAAIIYWSPFHVVVVTTGR